MLDHRRLLPVIAALGWSLLAAAPASSNYPPPGDSYASLSHGLRTVIHRTHGGTRLTGYSLEWRLHCSDHTSFRSGLVHFGERRVTVTPDGRFSYTTKVERAALPYHGHVEPARFKGGFSGRFSADGQSVSGLAHAWIRSKHRRCSGTKMPFAAFRDGSPQAPATTNVLATGTYAITGSRVRSTRSHVDVDAGASQLETMRFKVRIPCPGWGTLDAVEEGYFVPIGPSGRFHFGYPYLARAGQGIIDHDRFTIAGRFGRGATGGWAMRATVSIRSRLTRKGRTLTHCHGRVTIRGFLPG